MEGRVLFVTAAVCLFQFSSGHSTCKPHTNTSNGEIHGRCKTVVLSEDAKVDMKMFLGVPYAEPPVGEFRFQNPHEVKSWEGTLNATDYRSSCLRFKDDLFGPMEETLPTSGSHAGHDMDTGHGTTMKGYEGSEDCLYLNVFARNHIDAPLPVLVWFPGHERIYDATVLAAVGNVVVVTVSYRSGIFGFLSVNQPGFSGNYGLFDQKMAMEWVQNNIESFGGDAKRVTIAGQGISGAMVGLHLLHNVTQELFQRAISMSGFILDPFIVRDTHVMEHLVFDHLKCNDKSMAKVLECLQGKTVKELTKHLGHLRMTRPFTVIFGPTVDGDFLKNDPKTLLTEGHFTKVDYLLGGNLDDGSVLFNNIPKETIKNVNQTTFISYIRAISDATFTDPNTVSAAILGRYLMLGDMTYGDKLLRAGSDYIQGNSLMSAEKLVDSTKVYYFNFNYRPENAVNTPVVGYGQLIPFVLGNLFQITDYKKKSSPKTGNGNTSMTSDNMATDPAMDMNHTMGVNHTMNMNHTGNMKPMPQMNHDGHVMNGNHTIHMPMAILNWTDAEKNLSLSMMRAWAGFVKNGIPDMEAGLVWESFNSSQPQFLVWSTDMVADALMESPRMEVREFWARTIPVLDIPVVTVPPTTTASPVHNHGDHTTPGNDHGDHTTPGHDDHGSPVIDMDINTAAEAVLALTIIVCFLFVVVVVLLCVNFKYGPKYVARKEKESLNGYNNRSMSPDDIATKM